MSNDDRENLSLEHSIYHRLSSVLWGLIVGLIVLLAIYVSVGRMLSSNLGAFQTELLAELNARVPFTIEARRVSGEWHSFTPEIVLSGLRLAVPGAAGHAIELSEGRIGLDVLDSLRTRSLQVTTLQLDDLSLRGEVTAEGGLHLTGLSGGGGQIDEWLREFLLNIEKVTLTNNQLQLTLPSGESRDLALDLRLVRDGSYRRMDAQLVSTRGTRIHALAEGLGNPFKPELFSGDLYLDVDSGDLGAVKDMLAYGPPGAWAEGAMELELWLAWDRGKASVETLIEARDVIITAEDQSWQVPLERLALQASLVERKNRWTLFASDVELQQIGVEVLLPRVQLDAWGESLRIRAEDVSLAPINTLLTGLERAPRALANIFRILQPRGELASLQVNIGDISAPASDWGVEANFEDVVIESWKGAPGVTAANGYLDLAPGGGYVVLDSQQFTMEFPTIYRRPLYYDDIHGTINLEWDTQALVLSSGLVTLQAAEGVGHALFRLNIPLLPSPVGLEMDLMVGMENFQAIHRVKYVPYKLNQSLRDWLAGSIGEGNVERAGFIWRGSLRRGAAPLRTVQLSLKLVDTALDYHPDWPPVAAVDATVLIDDTNVSVWSDRARLFDSVVEHLSAEAWMNEDRQMLLAIDGSMRGPAADGLTVLNESMLSKMVGGAFADWQAAGDLHTQLQLQMNLADKSAPVQVDVATHWRDVDLEIHPGNLHIRSVNGEFGYNTDHGFSSSGLGGTLWGKPLTAGVAQRSLDKGQDYHAATSVIEVDLATTVAMADVQQWLDLEPLAFAQGEAAVDIQVQVPPGESVRLSLQSDLAGVSLDLPSPWNKSQKAQRQLRLDMPLARESSLVMLALESDLKLHLDVADGTLRAGSLAFGQPPAPLKPGLLRITGHAPLLNVEQWSRFIADYFSAGFSAVDNHVPPVETAVAEAGQRVSGLAIAIEELRADTLLLRGQQVQNPVFSLAVDDKGWQLSGGTDWLQGELFLPAGEGRSRLDVRYFDLAGLQQLAPTEDTTEDHQAELEQAALELPDMDVTLSGLSLGEHPLGNLAFALRREGRALHFDNITGDLASLQLTAQEPGSLVWLQGQDSQTELSVSLNFVDLSQALEHFGYEKILESEGGRLELSLQWPGGPQAFSLQSGTGSARVDIERGRFLEASAGASGALRVVGILNLAAIVRDLSLSHMFESGIPFHNIDGEVFLHDGIIEVARIDVQGSSSSFHFSGASDVAARSLDGELVATLPVANNLPWVAALAAGLPVAAGVFVVSKVFEDQVNRLSSGVYRISGSWDDPQVNFDRIFDSPRRDAGPVAEPTGGGELPSTAVESVAPVAPDPQTPLESEAPTAMDPQAPSQGGGA